LAKNLKLNIKNAQLAEVLKKNKLKKEQEQQEEKKVAPTAEKAATAETRPSPAVQTDEKKFVKAKKAPSSFSSPAEQKKPESQIASNPMAQEKKPFQAPLEKKAEEAKPSLQKTDEKQELKKPKTKEEIEEEAKAVERKRVKDLEAEEAKGKKNFSPSPKKQAFNKVFDARDRSGLRTGEDEAWRRKRPNKFKERSYQEQPVQRPKELSVKLPVNVKDLAAQMKLKASEVIQKLFLQGLAVTINDDLDDPTTVELIGHEFGCEIKIDTTQEDRMQVTGKSIFEEISQTDSGKLESRPPVVTVMGHVDHGKTSIIDSFRKSNIVAGESGAITQHIGAFQCKTKHGSFTVLDTPGHEAFSAIRQRGANVTDIVLLVIAGDEGIKPQTDEGIQKAKEAKVPIIVAINKKDKPGFNQDNIYRELADRDLLPEAWGGSVITVNCSAKTGDGIDSLAEMIAIQSDVLELKANPHTRARGTVLESELHRGLGPTATLLVQNGTLKIGDAILFEHEYGRVKTMQDEHGNRLESAPPSTPVRVTGLSGVPFAGNDFIAMSNEKEARKIAEERKSSSKHRLLRQSKGKSLEHLFQQKAIQQDQKVLNLILKADVGGSLEAIKTTLLAIPTEKVRLNFITTEVGQISESDIERAETANALILGFHTNVERHAENLIKKKKVTILLHDVIYHLVDEVKLKMLSLLDKIRQENEVGQALVLATFKSSQLGIIAGCKVEDGLIKRSNHAKLFRNGNMIWEGSISSLKRVQEDVKEVKKGLECGILLNGFKDVQAGDIIKAFEITYIEQGL
jgi:translation initiation factor IF-2